MRAFALFLILMTPFCVSASELTAGEAGLNQLNLESRQTLRRQHQQTADQRQAPTAPNQDTLNALKRRQVLHQRRLQAGQQREFSTLKLHRKTQSSPLPPGSRPQLKLEKFRREQGQQLRRFDNQRRSRLPIRPR